MAWPRALPLPAFPHLTITPHPLPSCLPTPYRTPPPSCPPTCRQSAVRRRLTQWLKERSPLLETLLLMDCSHMHAELPSLLQALSSPALRMLRLDACAGETHLRPVSEQTTFVLQSLELSVILCL